MTDASKPKGKKAAKDGDDEMTVVVPPSKATKQSAPAPADAEGDVDMGDEETVDDEKVDPVVQTVAGKHVPRAPPVLTNASTTANLHTFAQISRATLHC